MNELSSQYENVFYDNELEQIGFVLTIKFTPLNVMIIHHFYGLIEINIH